MTKEPVIFEKVGSKPLPVLKRRAILVKNDVESTNIKSKRTGEKRPKRSFEVETEKLCSTDLLLADMQIFVEFLLVKFQS